MTTNTPVTTAMPDPKPSRVIICGLFKFRGSKEVAARIEKMIHTLDNVEIVSPNTPGAAAFGERFAQRHHLNITKFVPNWEQFNSREAVQRRDEAMLDYATHLIVLGHPNAYLEKLAAQAEALGLPVRTIF